MTTEFNTQQVIDTYKAGWNEFYAEHKQFNADKLRENLAAMHSEHGYKCGGYCDKYAVPTGSGEFNAEKVANQLKTKVFEADRRDGEEGVTYPQILVYRTFETCREKYYKLIEQMFKAGFELAPNTNGNHYNAPIYKMEGVRFNRPVSWIKERNEKALDNRLSDIEKAEREKLLEVYFDRKRINDYVTKAKEQHIADQAHAAEMELANMVKQLSAKRDALTAEDEHYIAQSRVHSWNKLVENLSVKDGAVVKKFLEDNNFEKRQEKFLDKMRTVWVQRRSDDMTTEQLCKGMSPETNPYII